MVDFSKKLKNHTKQLISDPVKIYSSLDRTSAKVGPLRVSQEKILREWFDSRLNDKDIILKLNTGAGKTLVGLLMLESKRRLQESGNTSNYGIEMFLCNDSNLIQQTIQQANLFGISPTEVTADNQIPDEVINGEKILVTSVQKVFNGKSIFERADSPDVDTVVVDDAHASAELIKDSCTLNITKKDDGQLYTDIFDIVSEGLRKQGAGTFEDLKNYESSSKQEEPFLPVPYWTWIDKSDEITKKISQRAEDSTNIKFVWPLLRDRLNICNCIVSPRSIEITPLKYPIDLYTRFTRANQRVFMSATTASDSVLVNDLGISDNAVRKPLLDDDEKWSGEKMVIIPSLISEKLTRGSIVKLFGQPSDHNFGTTIITPGYYKTSDWEKYGSSLGTPSKLQDLLENFRKAKFQSPLVLINRYDGIDLPDNETRILIIDSMPNSVSLFDKYFDHTVPNGSETILRKAQKIEQGMGRSVRADTDYSVILFIGSDLVRFIRNPKFKRFFSKQTLEQIDIGIDNSKDAHNNVSSASKTNNDPVKLALHELVVLIKQSLERDLDWKSFYKQQMESVDYTQSPSKSLEMIVAKNNIMNMAVNPLVNIESFCVKVQGFIDTYCDTKEEKGWYFQLLAQVAYKTSKSKSKAYQTTAYNLNHRLLLPENVDVVRTIDLPIAKQRLENIIKQIKSYSNFENFFNAIEEITSNLSFGTKRQAFESSMDELGKILGFSTDRPDEYYKQGPDNLWAVKDNLYFVIEDKSEVKMSRDKIYKAETGQMNNSTAWFKQHYPSANFQAFLAIPTLYPDSAAGFNENVRIIREKSLRSLTDNLTKFAKEFHDLDFDSLSSPHILDLIKIHHLEVDGFVETYSEPHR